MRPQTNGMVERFNGRIEDILQSHRFHSGEDLEQTLLRYAHLYNNQLPQSALKGRTPIGTLKDWLRRVDQDARGATIKMRTRRRCRIAGRA